ncbi:hypothetical protein JCM33374_g5086 [Metschnikowia sp. JCM 33374]|nr:hypothetical protein JCM33374_g5086 [Metschnikowia sp. JCM 33374]
MSETFLDWDPAQVAQHFSIELGEDLRASFISHNIDGSLLPFLTTGHLRELGVESLATRLRLKKKINELLASHYAKGAPKSLRDGELRLNAIDINSNYVSMEALSLCSDLLRDLSSTTRQISDDTTDIIKLNENFKKLRMDLNPVIRLVKDSKPLPVPTLDPGAASSPTQAINSILAAHSWSTSDSENIQTPTTATTLVLPGASPNTLGFSPQNSSLSPANLPSPNVSMSAGSVYTQPNLVPKSNPSSSIPKQKPVSSPTQSRRFSSGSVLSVGVGKVTDLKTGSSSRFPSKPRLIDAKTSSGSVEDIHEASNYKPPSRQESFSGSRPVVSRNKLSSSSVTSSNPSTQSAQANQPLKQLKASSDDTCLKVLQHAMKRHHIPREKWSKYVLVVCYGDKERILKLTEKPVMIFKELQELGKNPAIMLRERASTPDNEVDYEDSRIGDEIPGGTL